LIEFAPPRQLNRYMLSFLSPVLALVVTGASMGTPFRAPSIRDVDFKNFTFNWYPRDADTPPTGRKIILTNGKMDTGFGFGKEPREFHLRDAEPINYGDLTGDGNDEAVLALGIITSGTARPGVVFVYTMSRGKPRRLLALETADRWDYGYRSATISDGELIIERYKPIIIVYRGQKHDMSSSNFYIRQHYKWNGARFRKIKTETVPADPKDPAPWAHRI
jgi:hypothetical protein